MHNANHQFEFKDLLVDFPKPGELAIFWAEQMELDVSAPYFGWGATPWDIMDWRLTMRGNLTDLMRSIAEEVTDGLRLAFFLPKEFDLAMHIMAIRSSGDEATMMNSWRRPPYDPYCPPKMDILLLKDLATLAAMSERSPYLALLEDVTVSQPEDQDWVYFLTSPETIIAGGWGHKV